MQTVIGAGDFKAKCLQLLDDVAEQREPLIITKRGKPVAKLVPVEPELQLFGALKGSVVGETDIVSPIDVEWKAAK
ncbi:MAG: type II toxin-antitoxin system Phd/YefM family antitoxin [Gallionella sp.]|nr:type II toxin-antitoxin system Phd/YefM family antitoxin [Gallionella sp.]